MTKTLLMSPFLWTFGFAVKLVDFRGWGGKIQ